MLIRRFLTVVLLALVLERASATVQAAGPTLQVEVDARELARRLLHADIRIPCRPGPLRLWYPKWIPGCHATEGPLQNVGGFRVETTDGKPIRWKRDDVELFCVHCDVPAGASEIRVHLDYICNEPAVLAAGYLSYGNSSVGVLNWNTCLVYPEGPTAQETQVSSCDSACPNAGSSPRPSSPPSRMTASSFSPSVSRNSSTVRSSPASICARSL